jgi:hypothetical protein
MKVVEIKVKAGKSRKISKDLWLEDAVEYTIQCEIKSIKRLEEKTAQIRKFARIQVEKEVFGKLE